MDGKAALVAAVVAVLAGVLMWVWSGRRKHVVLGTMALVGGLVAAGLSGFDALTAKDRAIRAYASDLARRTHAPEATALSAVRRLFDLGILRVSLATGIFLVLAGGAAAALAAAFSLGRSVEGLETEATTNSFASA